jgi:hypothetical protein
VKCRIFGLEIQAKERKCIMKARLSVLFAVLLASVGQAATNVAPTATIISAAMRPGTTLMDVTYQITDPDDATVKVRALAFQDGTRSFANVIRPVTWAEGTQTNLGDAITTGVNHTLTWDVRADWNIDLANVKFEVLCRDNRGLLPFDWITIPAAGGQPALTISKNAPTDAQVLDALFWQYAAVDPALILTNGVLLGSSNSGFGAVSIVNGANLQPCAPAYIFKQMNLDPASYTDNVFASSVARAGLANLDRLHVAARPYAGLTMVRAWGGDYCGQVSPVNGMIGVTAISGSQHTLVLKSDGTVLAYGRSDSGQINVPAGLSGVTAISAGGAISMALKIDGAVVAWGYGNISSVPAGLTGVKAIAAGSIHGLALKNDGTVVAWGENNNGQTSIPAGLTNVVAISAKGDHSLALKTDGTVVAWGDTSVPAGLTNVTAISAGIFQNLALKTNGTVVAWGDTSVPAGLTNVTAISAGLTHSLALKNDGTIVAWGDNYWGQLLVPDDLNGVIAISAGGDDTLALKRTAP